MVNCLALARCGGIQAADQPRLAARRRQHVEIVEVMLA
jgi:hypothetical protein